MLFNDSTDLIESQRAEQALRDADRKKDEFLATLAHELRNPLAPIRNAVQDPHGQGPADPELQWARGVIDRQVQHHGPAARRPARRVPHLSEQSGAPHGAGRSGRRGGSRRRNQPPGHRSRPATSSPSSCRPTPVYLEADPVRLAQVFANLLNNAAKYTEEGGHIRLSAERQGSDVVVSVKDTGIGIAAEMLPRIFEMFSQAKPALVRAAGRAGHRPVAGQGGWSSCTAEASRPTARGRPGK